MNETPVVFECAGEPLIGVLAVPASPAAVGVVIVVGGPQYRVGSHRQFVELSRGLAERGIACMRFDCRGMGDSAAGQRDFESIEEDVGAAVDCLTGAVASLEGVVLWGLCDGASASLMYAPSDARIVGVVALNPWVRSNETLAAARVDHYYRQRLRSRDFWRRLLSGEIAIGRALLGYVDALIVKLTGRRRAKASAAVRAPHFTDRMEQGWRHLRDRVLVILSGRDLTAQEFVGFCRQRPAWHGALTAGPNLAELPEADHTFSRSEWKRNVEEITASWVMSLVDYGSARRAIAKDE